MATAARGRGWRRVEEAGSRAPSPHLGLSGLKLTTAVTQGIKVTGPTVTAAAGFPAVKGATSLQPGGWSHVCRPPCGYSSL